nr:hypothetical protein [Entomoneis sp.]
MANIKNAFSSLKKNVGNKLANLKNRSQKFKENFEEAKSQPRSKRKSLFLGFSTVLGIFGVTLLTSVLPAVAKDIPKNTPTPGEVCSSPPANQTAIAPSKEIVKGLSGVAASVCALAVTSGSFAVGVACGVVVVFGILKAQGK